AEPGEVELPRDVAELGEVPAHLRADLVDVVERGAGELELAARLERDGGAGALERDQRAAGRLALGPPPVAIDQRLEHREHAPLALVGDGGPRRLVDPELLRLRADAVLRLGFYRLVEREEE